MQVQGMTWVGESIPPETRRARSERPRGPRDRWARRAELLGWFSIGLGIAQLFAPRVMAWLIGSKPRPPTQRGMRLLGARELVSGAGILGFRHPGFVWGRVIGDVMDLVLLGRQTPLSRRERARLLGATAAVLGVTWLDTRTALELRGRHEAGWRAPERATHIDAVVTIGRTREDVYAYFRDLENMPRFMSYLESVEVTDGEASFRARGPSGVELEWRSEIVEDIPGELLSWRSLEGAQPPNRGKVTFRSAPAGQGTEVRLELDFEPPLGRAGAALGRLLGKLPEVKLENDLRRLKQVLETGEVVHSDASVHRGLHPAQPSS